MEILNYTINQKIHHTKLSSVYHAVYQPSGRAVIIKTLNATHPRTQDVAKIRREFDIASRLQGVEGIIALHELVSFGNGNLAIVMEPFGQSLADFLKAQRREKDATTRSEGARGTKSL